MNTIEERHVMAYKAMGAGYHLTYIVNIIENMVDFDKATTGMSREKKLKLLEEDSHLSGEYFKRNDTHLAWLDILDMDKNEWNKIASYGKKMVDAAL
jgi:hypothetical protein